MSQFPEGNAIVYCEGAFNTPNGKTAHGLVRFTNRYTVLSVIDSRYRGREAGDVLDGWSKNIPIFDSLESAIQGARESGATPHYFVIGLAPDGGRLSKAGRETVTKALQAGLNVDSGLHDFLSKDPELLKLAREHRVTLRDVRKPPDRDELQFFSGKIEQVKALKIAVLGTDSAIGKRTTAWLLVQGLREAGYATELVGTGQTAWMQGARFGFIMDSLVSDFISGEIEHAVWRAWKEGGADVIVIEGQGSLMNPAYPGGFEILAAGRPDLVIMQHAPARREYDGFPGYPIHPLSHQIEAVQVLSGKPVVAITINHEHLVREQIQLICDATQKVVGIPALDVLRDGPDALVEVIKPFIKKPAKARKG